MQTEPWAFHHELDPELFTLDKLEALREAAPAGAFGAQLADTGFERPAGTGPTPVELEGTIAEEIGRRPLHLHFHDVAGWAPEYARARDQVFEAAGLDADEPRYAIETVIRIFSPDVPVALHSDGEIQLDCGVGGRNVWHVGPLSALSTSEHESLLRGGQFLRWRELAPVETFDLRPGDGFGSPPRWPHWLEHPGPDPAVSFEVGYWTAAAIRERKIWDVNWMLRKARLNPRGPGANASRDAAKTKLFDLISQVTGKGKEFRGA